MIKKIIIYTFGNQSHENSITMAASFAARNNAQLVGLYIKPDFMSYSTVYGYYPLNLAEAYYSQQQEFANKTKKQFDDIVSRYDIDSQWYQTNEYEKKPKPAFYADMIFVSQPQTESSVIFNDTDLVDQLITETGLPVVIIPKNWAAETFAEQPILGWKESREAVVAVRHSIPVMQQAKNVDIVTITSSTDLEKELIEGIEISDYLSMHNVKTEYFAEHVTEHDKSEADTLLRHVNNRGRDLIIIGGYGHSRFREIILGGMTRALIKRSPVPVLLAH